MNETLKKLKLAQEFTFELPIDKQTFVQRLKKRTEPSDLGFFSSFGEGLSSNDSRYKGKVDSRSFKIRKRKGLSKYQKQKAIAEGVFRERGDQLIVDVKINGIDTTVIVLLMFIPIFFFFVIYQGIMFRDSFFQIIMPIAVCVQLLFLYFQVRKSVREIKDDLTDCFSKIVKQGVTPISK